MPAAGEVDLALPNLGGFPLIQCKRHELQIEEGIVKLETYRARDDVIASSNLANVRICGARHHSVEDNLSIAAEITTLRYGCIFSWTLLLMAVSLIALKHYFPLFPVLFWLNSISVSEAVTISIIGDPSSSTAEVSLSGVLTMGDMWPLGSGGTGIVYFPLNRVYNNFGQSSAVPSTSPFSLDDNHFPGLLPDDARVIISDTSEANRILADWRPVSLSRRLDGSYNIGLDVWSPRPTNISFGDIATFSGSFDIDLSEGDFADNFVEGRHFGNFGGQSVVVEVIQIPEPSTLVFVVFGLCLSAEQRRRRS